MQNQLNKISQNLFKYKFSGNSHLIKQNLKKTQK